jgi:hypothetical protein
MVLGEDWCGAFNEVKGCGEEKVILGSLKRRKGDFW